MILLEEAATAQIVQELKKRSDYMLLIATLPTNNDQEVIECWKGSYIERGGLVNMAKANIEYHNRMLFKSEFNDDPEAYFDAQDKLGW